MTEIIKCCPFCGINPELRDVPDTLAANGKWFIECIECQLALQTYYIANGYPGADKRKMLTLAVSRWNRRKSAQRLNLPGTSATKR